jgi:predicted HTH transcriptional regulator
MEFLMLPPENDRTEYKEQLIDNIERVVIAFLNNKEGGEIYIGVKDSGEVVGVQNCDAVQLAIKDKIKDNICPSALGLYDIKCVKIDHKEVVKIIVASGPEKPYYLKNKGMSENGCFMRIGSAIQTMPAQMIEELYAMRVRQSLARIVSPRQKLSFAQLEIYYKAKGYTINDEFAYNLDLLTEDGKYNYVGFLCADTNSISIKFGKYASLNKCELIENKEYGYNSIVKATESILEKLNIENRNYTKITGGQRIDTPMIDERALREAVINAIVHNDYSYGNPPVFEMYPDRLEITSNGGLGYFGTQEEFFRGRSNPKNRELMRIFKDLGYVEEMGSGIHRILEKYPRSIFEFSRNYITVAFPFASQNGAIGVVENGENVVRNDADDVENEDDVVENVVENESNDVENEDGVVENEDWLLHKIGRCEILSVKDYAKIAHLSIRTAQRHFAALKNAGKIRRVGPDKGGRWEVIKS